MGYVHDTKMSLYVPPNMFSLSAGTWTLGVASNLVSNARTATAATFNLFAPIPIPQNYVALKGARFLSLDLLYQVSVAALNSVTTVEIEKQTMPAQTVAPTGAALASTVDALNNTSALRYAVAYHTMNVAPNNQEWMDAAYAYWLYVTFDAPATAVVTLYGMRVNYLLRL